MGSFVCLIWKLPGHLVGRRPSLEAGHAEQATVRSGSVWRCLTQFGAAVGRYGGCSVEVKGHTVSSLVSHAQPVYQPYLTICEGHRLCSTYRTTYRVAQRQVYQKVSQLACCPGWKWTKSPSQFGCNEAICRPVCRNGGTCLLPHKCLCPPGWTGRCCQTDVDECARGRHGCSQLCFNVAGSYRCTCRQGHTLLEDGKTCRALEAPPKSTATTRSSDPPVRDEVADLRTRMAALEDTCRRALAPFLELDAAGTEGSPRDPASLLVHALQQLDRVESLSEQVSFLEGQLETCSCKKER
uniref:EGF like domain multiple 7 n=1 Tax=Varanus komodoensis TaxID=61221 RepID=A0A8D2LBM4_VARKO